MKVFLLTSSLENVELYESQYKKYLHSLPSPKPIIINSENSSFTSLVYDEENWMFSSEDSVLFRWNDYIEHVDKFDFLVLHLFINDYEKKENIELWNTMKISLGERLKSSCKIFIWLEDETLHLENLEPFNFIKKLARLESVCQVNFILNNNNNNNNNTSENVINDFALMHDENSLIGTLHYKNNIYRSLEIFNFKQTLNNYVKQLLNIKKNFDDFSVVGFQITKIYSFESFFRSFQLKSLLDLHPWGLKINSKLCELYHETKQLFTEIETKKLILLLQPNVVSKNEKNDQATTTEVFSMAKKIKNEFELTQKKCFQKMQMVLYFDENVNCLIFRFLEEEGSDQIAPPLYLKQVE